LRERIPGLTSACAASAAQRGAALQRHIDVNRSTPDALAATRSTCRASTPTPILSAVLPMTSAGEIERSNSAASPP
jgi:hypothetical protein